MTGESDLSATNTTRLSLNTYSCTFNINGKRAGKWKVNATNLDTQSGELVDGFTVKAQAVVSSINPTTAANTTSSIYTINGNNIWPGATTKLKMFGQQDINGTDVSVVNTTKIIGTFNLNGVAPGAWDVCVKNLESNQGVLRNALSISAPAPTVASILPLEGNNNGIVSITDLEGANFYPGAIVKLARGNTTISANSTTPVPIAIA